MIKRIVRQAHALCLAGHADAVERMMEAEEDPGALLRWMIGFAEGSGQEESSNCPLHCITATGCDPECD